MAGRKALAITERQFSVLRVLWEQGPLTVRELMEHLPGGDRQPYTTVLGLLQNMQKAGLVEAEKEGLTHRYRPSVSRQEATGSLLSDFLTRFFHGSAEQLILGLVDARQARPRRAQRHRGQAGVPEPAENLSRRNPEAAGSFPETEEEAMIEVTDRWVVPLLVFLADWSVRWGLVLAALALWLALRPPRLADHAAHSVPRRPGRRASCCRSCPAGDRCRSRGQHRSARSRSPLQPSRRFLRSPSGPNRSIQPARAAARQTERRHVRPCKSRAVCHR